MVTVSDQVLINASTPVSIPISYNLPSMNVKCDAFLLGAGVIKSALAFYFVKFNIILKA